MAKKGRLGVVWCGVVWCGVVWCGVVWCGVLDLRDLGDGKTYNLPPPQPTNQPPLALHTPSTLPPPHTHLSPQLRECPELWQGSR